MIVGLCFVDSLFKLPSVTDYVTVIKLYILIRITFPYSYPKSLNIKQQLGRLIWKYLMNSSWTIFYLAIEISADCKFLRNVVCLFDNTLENIFFFRKICFISSFLCVLLIPSFLKFFFCICIYKFCCNFLRRKKNIKRMKTKKYKELSSRSLLVWVTFSQESYFWKTTK